MIFSPHLSRSTLAYNARSVRAGPLRSCVPPLPYATPAAVVGLRNMLPRTEWDSRSGNHDATFAERSDMPVPARHTTCLPLSMGKATSRSRIDITTAGRFGVLLLPSPSPPRGVDPPVRPVLAPWGMMVQSASTMDLRQSIASWMVWGLTMARADPCPRRAPLRYGADDASDSDPERTRSFPTMDRSLVGRLRCSSVSGGACCLGGDDDGDDSQEQQDRGRPLGSTCGR
mmetsp:Transcript_28048/g.81073  ORF Transcript_28048/g.81073 Transcript_28048/m.81073 type:complete len:229 (+) Transcript_28048:1262-1948(+)